MTLRLAVLLCRDGRLRHAWATTLGAGGLFVSTATPRTPGEHLEVSFQLPGEGRTRSMAARVAWVQRPDALRPARGAGMGLAFVDPTAIASLARALERLPDRSAPPPGPGES